MSLLLPLEPVNQSKPIWRCYAAFIHFGCNNETAIIVVSTIMMSFRSDGDRDPRRGSPTNVDGDEHVAHDDDESFFLRSSQRRVRK
jgi:hypothetical protein